MSAAAQKLSCMMWRVAHFGVFRSHAWLYRLVCVPALQ
jgi:hypothetical protein